MANKIVHAASGHTLFIKPINREELPAGMDNTDPYKQFYVVKNWDDNGVVFFYLAKGDERAPREIVAWYGKHLRFWAGFGKNFLDAINGAQRDGWMYA